MITDKNLQLSVEEITSKLKDPAFLSEHRKNIDAFANGRKSDVEHWRTDIREVLEWTWITQRDIIKHKKELYDFIKNEYKSLYNELKGMPWLLEQHPDVKNGFAVYQALYNYIISIGDNSGKLIIGDLKRFLAVQKGMRKEIRKLKLQQNGSVHMEQIGNIWEQLKEKILRAISSYEEWLIDANRTMIADIVKGTLWWSRWISQKRKEELLEKLTSYWVTALRTPEENEDIINWWYVRLQLKAHDEPENQIIKYELAKESGQAHILPGLRKVWKIELPDQKRWHAHVANNFMQEVTFDPDTLVGSKIESAKEFCAKLGIENWFLWIDRALAEHEKVYGMIIKKVHDNAVVLLGEVRPEELDDNNNRKYITTTIPRTYIHKDLRDIGVVLPIAIISKSINRNYVESWFKHYIMAEVYDEKEHTKIGAIGHALSKQKDKDEKES